tara:strand:- start:119 stop:331 length:213 start_codon:yes stop_codon:yes gene_type:complete
MTTMSYKLNLNDSEMIMLEEALNMMIEKCEREININPRGPFISHLKHAKALYARRNENAVQTSGNTFFER